MKRIVRLRTRDKRYIKASAYPFVPAQKGINGVYLTGQIIDPRNPDTKNFLTLAEASGEAKTISKEKLELFPYIINPFDVFPLTNGQKFNIGIGEDGKPLNNEDYAKWKMLLLNDHIVAGSESLYNPKSHAFYFEDIVAMAEEKTTRKRRETILMSHVFNLTPLKQKDLMLLLNIYDTTFKENPNVLSPVLIEDKIVKCIEKNPNVLNDVFDKDGGFSKKAIDDLMVAKLVHIGEIRINITEFYYQNTFLGNTVQDVQKWMRDKANITVVNKWSAMLSKLSDGAEIPQNNVGLGEETLVIDSKKKLTKDTDNLFQKEEPKEIVSKSNKE